MGAGIDSNNYPLSNLTAAFDRNHDGWDLLLSAMLTASLSFLSLWLIHGFQFFGSNHKTTTLLSNDSSAHKVENISRDAFVVYASQTGTAENYAKRIRKVLEDQCQFDVLITDVENFELEQLLGLPDQRSGNGKSALLVLLTSTYGDGEPPDSAIEFHTAVKNISEEDSDRHLKGLDYAVFGLGNSSYELFNKQANDYDQFFCKLGGSRLCAVGVGDDNTGTTDEDFHAWKEQLLEAIVRKRGIEVQKASSTRSSLQIQEEHRPFFDGDVFLGERNESHLQNSGLTVEPFTASNPYYAPVSNIRQLFNTSCERHCLHIEFDITKSDLVYETGDHLAVWPVNPETEIERLLRLLNMVDKRDTVFRLKSSGAQASISLPTPTTYETALRHYLDICGPISRSTLESLAIFAPSNDARDRILKLAKDKDDFESTVHAQKLSLAHLLELASNGEPWPALPFTFILDHVPLQRSRHYSISSSSKISSGTIHITAAIKDEVFFNGQHLFKGLTSQYFMAVAKLSDASSSSGSHQLRLPRSQHADVRVAVNTRRSHFRLPKNPSIPILMIGPGTGVAPFRGFLAEKMHQSKHEKIGKCMLFTGSRRQNEDFLYKEEWGVYQQALEGQFELHTAFSREGPQKVYVQHRLREQAESVFDMLYCGNATVYICGDVKMAKDVTAALIDVLIEHLKCSADDARKIIGDMKASGRFQASNMLGHSE